MTFHAKELQSYSQLPQLLYHFSIKERDEPRPRGGLLRAARVHHEGRVLVRPSTRRASTCSFGGTARRTRRSSRAAGSTAYDVRGRVRDDGRHGVRRLPRAVGIGREHARHAARTATSRPTSRSRAASRARPTFPEPLRRADEVETPGVTTCEALADFLSIDVAATSKAMPVTTLDGTVVLALVRGDDRLEPAKLAAALGTDTRPATDDEIRAAFGAGGGSLGPVGFEGEVIADEALARGTVRRGREPRRLPSSRRRGRPRLRAALRGHPRVARRATAARSAAARSSSRRRSRSATSSSSARATPSRSGRRSSTRTARSKPLVMGVVRHRAGPRHGRRGRAAPRRERHGLAARDRAVRRARRRAGRRRRDRVAGGAGAVGRRGSTCSSTTATCARGRSSPTPT